MWLTLLEKRVRFRPVMVNLLTGEQRSPSYLTVNPQVKLCPPAELQGSAPPFLLAPSPVLTATTANFPGHDDDVRGQGKVPALRVQNVPGLPDCCLFESQAIVEWLEEVARLRLFSMPMSFLAPSLVPQPSCAKKGNTRSAPKHTFHTIFSYIHSVPAPAVDHSVALFFSFF